MITLHNKKSLYLLLITVLCSCNFAACSAYKKHFGGTGQNYKDAQTTDSLKATNNKFPQTKNEHYQIPEITIMHEPVTDILPPDYISSGNANKDQEKN